MTVDVTVDRDFVVAGMLVVFEIVVVEITVRAVPPMMVVEVSIT